MSQAPLASMAGPLHCIPTIGLLYAGSPVSVKHFSVITAKFRQPSLFAWLCVHHSLIKH